MKNLISNSPARIFVFILIVIFIIGYFINYKREYFGKEAKGVVLKLKGNGSRQIIDYKFKVGGKTYYGHGTITFSSCGDNECIGNKCLVIYDKDNPDDSRATEIIVD